MDPLTGPGLAPLRPGDGAAPRSGGGAGRLRRRDRRRRPHPLPRLGRRARRTGGRAACRAPERSCSSTAWRRPPGAGRPVARRLRGVRPCRRRWTCGATGSPTRRPTGYGRARWPATRSPSPKAPGCSRLAGEPARRAARARRASATGPSSPRGRPASLGDRCAASSWSTAAGRISPPRPGRPPRSGSRPSRSRRRCSRRWAPGWPTARPSTRRTWDADQERAARAQVVETAAGRVKLAVHPHALAGSVRAMWSYDPAAVLPTVEAPIAALVARDEDGSRVAALRGVARAAPGGGPVARPRRRVPGARAQPGALRARRGGRGRARGLPSRATMRP